ncbi:MAG: MFS transporter [Chloroflexi bacterium]|nr:MFS transporter [Chloroflexota bacterium]
MAAAPQHNKLWNRNFAVLWAGQTQSYLGDAFLNIGLMWFVLELTGSAAAAATVLVLGGLPKLLGPLTGILVDRADKKTLMIASDVLRGALLILMYLLFLWDKLQVWHLYALIVLLSALSIIYGPSLRVLLPRLVPNESLPAANSALQASLQVSTIVGASLAGVALVAFGAPMALLIDGISFLVAAVAIALVRLPQKKEASSKTLQPSEIWRDLLDGLRYILTSREVLVLTALAFIINLVLSPVNVIFPVFSKDVLGAGVAGFGLLASTIAIGLFLGNIVVGSIGDRLHYTRSILTGLAIMCFGLVGLGFSLSLLTALLFTALLGSGVPFIQVALVTRLQRAVPPMLQGRVFSTLEAVVTLALPIAAGLAGRALMTYAVSSIFYVAAAGIFLVAVAWTGFSAKHYQPDMQPS